MVGVHVGDDHGIDVDVVTEPAQLGEDAVAAVQEDAGALLLHQIAAACPRGVLPGRRLAQHRNPQLRSFCISV